MQIVRLGGAMVSLASVRKARLKKDKRGGKTLASYGSKSQTAS